MKSSVLFVCLGNICRSPAAEGVFRHLITTQGLSEKIQVQSCGLGAWHVGHPPDVRMTEVAGKRGFKLESRAQIFVASFFDQFDYILAADQEVLQTLLNHVPSHHRSKVSLITHFSQIYADEDVPDPYYGNDQAFEQVMDILEDSCQGLLLHILSTHK